MTDADSVEVGDPYESLVTVTVGYALFGAYNWITVIVLLNMLIAMMARSYEFIEVKYAPHPQFISQIRSLHVSNTYNSVDSRG